MIEKEELLSLIPHRGDMMLLDRINKYDMQEKYIEAEYDITEECLFYDKKHSGVPAWAGFEFVAQAISAFIGIRNRENGLPSKEGYILGVSQMEINIPFYKNGSTVKIKSRELENVHPVYVFQGEVLVDDKEALCGKLTVMEVEKDEDKTTEKE